jgi:hypothetical protein
MRYEIICVSESKSHRYRVLDTRVLAKSEDAHFGKGGFVGFIGFKLMTDADGGSINLLDGSLISKVIADVETHSKLQLNKNLFIYRSLLRYNIFIYLTIHP